MNKLNNLVQNMAALPAIENPEAFIFDNELHSTSLLESLYLLYNESILADVVIEVGVRRYSCHKNILAASSPFFKALFTTPMCESLQEVITLREVDSEAFQSILRYIYTGNIHIDKMNAQYLLAAASLFQITSLHEACAKYMESQLDVQNCLGIYHFASIHSCEQLKSKAKEFLDKNFRYVVMGEEFQQLTVDKLCELLQSNDLNVEKEEDVFEALLTWVKHDPSSRKHSLGELMPLIRFGLINSMYIQENISRNKFIAECPKCLKLLQDMREFEMNPETYQGDHIFNIVLRSGMIKPEHCILLLGGVAQSKVKPTINCYNTLTRECYSMSSVQNNRFESPFVIEDPACVVTSGNDIFLGGGTYVFHDKKPEAVSDDSSFDELEEEVVREEFYQYDSDHDRWIQRASMLFPKANFSLAYLDGMIYSFGGLTLNQHPTEIIEKYDIAQNKWSYVGMLPNTLIDLSTVVYNNEIYILGGRTGVGSHNIVMKYNPAKDEWTSLAGMPTPRFKFGTCAIQDEIYVVGGQIYTHRSHVITRESLSAVEIYNISTNQWRQGPDLPEDMFNVGLFFMRGSLFACGTTEFRRTLYRVYRFNVVYKLDLGKMQWQQVESDLCDLRDFVCVAAKMHTRKLSQVFRPDVDT